MPAATTLSTVSGTLIRERGYTSKTVKLFGRPLATEAGIAVSIVPGIAAAVARFGARVRAEHLDASFYVLIRLATGHRKPNGFGQDDFLHVEEGRTMPDMPAIAPALPAAPEQAAASGGAA